MALQSSFTFVLRDGDRSPSFQKLLEDYLRPYIRAQVKRRNVVDKAIDQLILEAFGALVVARMKMDVVNVQHFGGGITIDQQMTKITQNVNNYHELDLFASCGTHGQRCDIEWHGYVTPRPGVGVLRLKNTTYMIDWLTKEIPDGCTKLNRALALMYPGDSAECISWHARFGLPDEFMWASQQGHGEHDGFHYTEVNNRDFDMGGQYPLQMILKSKNPLSVPNSLCTVITKTCPYSCPKGCIHCCPTANGLPCPGCLYCNYPGKATPPIGQFLNGNLGQPYAMGGVIPKSNNTVPVLLTPGSNYLPAGPKNMAALHKINNMNPKSPKDVTEILEFLEREIDVKVGMLSGQNIFLHRITIYDREDWQEKVREHLDLIRSRLGDKIGNIGDMRIVSLDQIDYPEESPLHGSKPTTAVGRKFSVHAAYRLDYQAIKLTIMALVKA